VPLEKVSEGIATPSSTTQQVEKISGVKIHTKVDPAYAEAFLAMAALCNTTYRPKALMPLRWSTLCPYVRHDLSSLEQTGTTGIHPPLGEVTYCELALLHTDLCTVDETAAECIARLGAARLQHVLARRCTLTTFFQQLLNTSKGDTSSVAVRGGMILESMIEVEAPVTYMPPEQRPRGHNIPWRPFPYGQLSCNVNRITMGLPLEVIVKSVERRKMLDIYPLRPLSFPMSSSSTYSFGSNDEAVLREAQRRSFFTLTHRRGCWTAQRHYDGLASGAIPLFYDLQFSREPQVELPMYPVDLVLKARELDGVRHLFDEKTRKAQFVDNGSWYLRQHKVYNVVEMPAIDMSALNKTAYFELADRLLEYTRANLTTIAVASHFLRAMNLESSRTVLIYQNYFFPDMLTLIHGLASMGLTVYITNQDHVSKLPKGTTEPEAAEMRDKLFWRGFRAAGHLYGFRSPASQVKACGSDRCLELIKEKRFDIVVYSIPGALLGDDGLHNDERFPHLNEVRRVYTPAQIAFVDSADDARSMTPNQSICSMGRLFTREHSSNGIPQDNNPHYFG
jgi:hypothetical protein